ncbi:MAG TPA: hypothetical protein VL442_07430 [Mucilaginibacter sp.]|nr:hypothetical protein [Mucilaginibacter sp.]
MKTSIKLIALFMLMSTGAFASIHVRSYHKSNYINSRVSLVPLKHSRGFAVMVDKNMPGNSLVMISDVNGDVFFKQKLHNGMRNETKYLTTQLEDGQYTVEVYSKDHDVKTKFYIYNNGYRRIEDIN